MMRYLQSFSRALLNVLGLGVLDLVLDLLFARCCFGIHWLLVLLSRGSTRSLPRRCRLLGLSLVLGRDSFHILRLLFLILILLLDDLLLLVPGLALAISLSLCSFVSIGDLVSFCFLLNFSFDGLSFGLLLSGT